MDTVRPVSYTHLDVYKRQTLISMEGGPVRNLEDSQVKIQYLLYKSLIHGGTKYAEMLYRKMCIRDRVRVLPGDRYGSSSSLT